MTRLTGATIRSRILAGLDLLALATIATAVAARPHDTDLPARRAGRAPATS